MPVHFPSEAGPPAETPHGRINGRASASVRLGFHFLRREPGDGHDFTGLAGRFNSAFASRSLQTAIWVANFDSEVPALNRRELGANPRRPTNLSEKLRVMSAESRMAVSTYAPLFFHSSLCTLHFALLLLT